MKNYYSPSIMCLDVFLYKKYISDFEKVGIDYIHFDIMDGHFVPNITLGTTIYEDLKKATEIPLDIHLMVTNPELFLPNINIRENDIVTIHYETTHHPYKLLQQIRDMGCKPFIALNPGTPVEFIEEIINLIDGVLVMTVNPGFAGQEITSNAFDKVKKLRKLTSQHNKDVIISVDGNVTYENAIKLKSAGANMFVLGTSSVLNPKVDFIKSFNKLKKKISKYLVEE